MDVRRFSGLLIALGLILVVGSAAWWWHFYAPLAHEADVSMERAVRCLYSSAGACGFVTGAAQFAGKTPYEPILLWIGGGAFLAGLLIRLSLRRG